MQIQATLVKGKARIVFNQARVSVSYYVPALIRVKFTKKNIFCSG